jgi:AraC family transcriptional regulator, regulatory protein of adaptative response / methylated-DNA-[protein]-cysteine methyltransferase
MVSQENCPFHVIARAINCLRENIRHQPDLEEIARSVHLSASDFQRIFSEWAGTSIQKFQHYISIEHANALLSENKQITISENSGHGEHDQFISIEQMKPAEYHDGGKDLIIHYDYGSSPFGNILIASTQKGICHLSFEDSCEPALEMLKSRFPNAVFQNQSNQVQQNALNIFSNEWTKVKLHLKGTGFQIKVWESLLKIPFGKLSTYSRIALHAGSPNACRAAGTAIGSNPVAFLIPCHRVIQSSGKIEGYRWGSVRKSAIIGWEQAVQNTFFKN